MTWFFLGMLTAFFESTKDVASKKSLQQDVNKYIVSWAYAFFTFVFLAPIVSWLPIPDIQPKFWLALIFGSSLNVLATVLYIQAIQISDLSLVTPLVTFTPLFLLFTSPILVGEIPAWTDFLGVFLVIGGAYFLNFQAPSRGYFAPLRSLLQEPGSRWMLCVAFLWSLTSNFDKMGVQNSSPLFWVVASYGAISAGLFAVVLCKAPKDLRQLQRGLRGLSFIGFFNALTVTCQMSAISLTPVVNVIALKRTSALWSVLWGHLLFQESGLRQRMGAAAIAIAGVVLITLF